jgi:hypothetical protein
MRYLCTIAPLRDDDVMSRSKRRSEELHIVQVYMQIIRLQPLCVRLDKLGIYINTNGAI